MKTNKVSDHDNMVVHEAFIVPPVQLAIMPGQLDCTTHMSDLVKKGKERTTEQEYRATNSTF